MAKTHKGSWNDLLVTFDLGKRHYVETTLDGYAQLMATIIKPPNRRASVMGSMKFSARLFTAIAAQNVRDVRYLICIERTE